MRLTLSLIPAAAGGVLLGFAASSIIDAGPATPIVAIVGVVSVMLAITGRANDDLSGDLQSEHGWFWRELSRELDRSRRHECEFVLARLQPSTPGASNVASSAGLLPWPTRMGRLAGYLRSSDRTWQDADGQIYILLPETGRKAGLALLARINGTAPDLVPLDGLSIATFPQDGPTSGALLAALGKRPQRAGDSGASPQRSLGGTERESDQGAA
jgi:hypothetical protein